MASLKAPLTAELCSLQLKSLNSPQFIVLTFDLRQRMPGHGFVGDIEPFRYGLCMSRMFSSMLLAIDPLRLLDFFNTKRSISVIHKEQSYLTREQCQY
jgi:hypothetical protein